MKTIVYKYRLWSPTANKEIVDATCRNARFILTTPAEEPTISDLSKPCDDARGGSYNLRLHRVPRANEWTSA